MNANEFCGKVAVVTGGTGGIGRALALTLAGRGCRVWFCGRNGDREETEKACGGLGRFVRCDLSRPGEPERFVAEVLDAEGRIDYLVNNVAFDGRLAFEETNADEFDRFVGINLKAAFLVTRAALPGLRSGEGKAVVNLGTTNWMLGLAPFTLYGAAKSGLVGFTRALARELGPERIRVNLLSPGWVMTAKQLECYVEEEDKQQLLRDQALPFLLEETHITGPALFLLSSAAAAVTGQNLVVDGGKLMQ